MPRDEVFAHIDRFPNSNPYRTILLHFQSLPKTDRERLTAWAIYETPEGEPSLVLDPAQERVVREIRAALLTASSQGDTAASDWPPLPSPHAPEDPTAITVPGTSLVRHIAQIATKSTASLPPAEAARVYAAIAKLGRQQRFGVTLGEQAAGAGIEAAAQTEIARRLSEFSDDDLALLSDAWTRLPAPPSTEELLENEITRVLRPIVEIHLAPALRALLAEAERAPREEPSALDPDAGFTRDIRLSALLHVAENEHRIVLQDIRTQETFTLRLAQAVRGIELVSIDYEKHHALIRRGTREALVHLESKQIIERDPAASGSRTKFLSRTDQKLLVRIRAHPEGVDGVVRKILAENEAHLRDQRELAELPECLPPPEIGSIANGNYLVANPSFGHALRNLNRAATQAAMLQAALQHRRNQLHPVRAQPPTADPWSENSSEAFRLEPGPDGGFVLRSRYETRPGEPVAFKFASLDAGRFRVSPMP
jgi:hypothetical protein